MVNLKKWHAVYDARRHEAAHSDIAQHLPFLRFLARGVHDVVEVGTHDGTSALAFLLARPRRLVCCDITRDPAVDELYVAARELEVEFEFVLGDSKEVFLPPADLYFIDSLHTRTQVATELTRFAPLTRKYLAFHDTVSWAWLGQEDVPGGGINEAIGDFLRGPAGDDWRLTYHSQDCNGLTVLTRVGAGSLYRPTWVSLSMAELVRMAEISAAS